VLGAGAAAAQHGTGPHINSSTVAAASSQRRLHQIAIEDIEFTGLLVDPARLGAALIKASKTAGRAEVAAKEAEPARRLLLRRRTIKASAVDGYPELVWRDVVRPASFDARTLGVLSPIKDQGRCAACVAFAVTAAAEAAIALAQPEIGNTIIKQGGLSPQQLYFCQRDRDRSCRQVCELGRACMALGWKSYD
jgi:C1A family cysteine protease